MDALGLIIQPNWQRPVGKLFSRTKPTEENGPCTAIFLVCSFDVYVAQRDRSKHACKEPLKEASQSASLHPSPRESARSNAQTARVSAVRTFST